MLGRKISIKMILTDVFAIAIMLAVCDVFLIYLAGYRHHEAMRSVIKLRSVTSFIDLIQHPKHCVAGGLGFSKSAKR
jgi:Mn2+/Fe2+ NRAMP family transporter